MLMPVRALGPKHKYMMSEYLVQVGVHYQVLNGGLHGTLCHLMGERRVIDDSE